MMGKKRDANKNNTFLDVQISQIKISAFIAAALLFFKLLAPGQAESLKEWYSRLDAVCGPEAHIKAVETILPGIANGIERAAAELRLLIEGGAQEAFSPAPLPEYQSGIKLGLVRPLESCSVTYSYGFREDPFTGDWSFHSGTDYAAPQGTPVHPVADGAVEKIGFNETYGKFVTVRHTAELYSVYAHLDSISVFIGQYVNCGFKIGEVGSTGRSTGYHLHLEIITAGYRVDPESFFNRAV